jgi:superfamily II DNA or RNA helicase
MTGAATADAPALRDYQRDAITRFDKARAAGRRRIAIVSPTGSGKTLTAAAIIQREADAGRRVLFIAPRRELVHQAAAKLEAVGIKPGYILAGDDRHNAYAPIQVASVDTLRARHHKLSALDPHVIVLDECHLYVTGIRTRLLARWPSALLIGLTATPARKDGRGLRVLFDTLIEVSTPAELTKQGHLVPARYFSVSEPDMSRVASIAGDYKVGEAERAMAPLIADVVQTWLARAGGRRTVVFCMCVAHSVSLRALFAAAGVRAEHVDGSTPLELRAAILERFARGDTEVLCNVMVASIGFDVPPVDCIVLARPTKSLVMYLQMIGRGLRPAPGKRDCLILDHSGTVHRLGFAADERCWTLDGHADLSQARAAREGASGKSCTCPECACVFVGSRVCPECGHYIAPKGREIMTLEGDLVEIGPALTAEHADKLAFFLELRGFAVKRGFKPGFAAHVFKERHGAFPPWNWNAAPAAEPTLATSRWLEARYRARLKAASV